MYYTIHYTKDVLHLAWRNALVHQPQVKSQKEEKPKKLREGRKLGIMLG
jgi:hypothetical protein